MNALIRPLGVLLMLSAIIQKAALNAPVTRDLKEMVTKLDAQVLYFYLYRFKFIHLSENLNSIVLQSDNLSIIIPLQDIDECAQNLHNCDKKADCINEPRTFSCECKEGYTGNGTSCLGSVYPLLHLLLCTSKSYAVCFSHLEIRWLYST